MKKLCVFTMMLLVVSLATSLPQILSLVKIYILNEQDISTLRSEGLTIDYVGEGFVHAFASDRQILKLRTRGCRVDVLIEDYQAHMDEVFSRGFYHSYEETYFVLDSFANQYPDICRLDTIGYSVMGRAIWAMRVTDNPQIEECEAEIRLKGNMHGWEHIGTEITLFFLRHLLTQYGSDSQVTDLVDNCEFWIIPVQNPDGKVYNIYTNINGVNLNRDYGWFWDAWGSSSEPCSQVETRAVVQHMLENNPSFEWDYHSWPQSTDSLFYPWDYHFADPPDSQHIIAIVQLYSDSSGYDYTNGFDLFQICGSSMDHMIGIGTAFSYASEHPDVLDSLEIDTVCVKHCRALMAVCERAQWGIEGVVRDSLTNAPLYARIEFTHPDRIDAFSDPNLGDFHKMIEPGTYDLRISANGYAPKTIDSVSVPANGSVSVGDVLLAPDSTHFYAFRALVCRYADHAIQGNVTQPRYALGGPDTVFYSLGTGSGDIGFVVLDMGSNSLIADGPGDDFTVYEGDDGFSEGYYVYVTNDWTNTWISCGADIGTASFDLATAGLSSARYVKIVDDGSYVARQYAGFDLDAIQITNVTGVQENMGHVMSNAKINLRAYPNPFHHSTNIRYQIADNRQQCELKVYDITGRLVADLSKEISVSGYQSSVEWDGRDDQNGMLGSGVYFLRFQIGDYSATQKVMLIR